MHSRRFLLVLLLTAVLAGAASASVGAQGDGGGDGAAVPDNELTAPKALVLGVVEGVTEYLPISSTGHLLVAERILDVGQKPATEKAVKDYTVVIQAGAILAVVALFWKRIVQVLEGLLGRDPAGRKLLINLILAFLPAAALGLAFDNVIEEKLLSTGPVIIAWLVGGVAILFIARRFGDAARGVALDELGHRHALIIGVAQAAALWPGTSRSLVTIVAGLLVGLSVAAAVEFSFLLGLATLTAATGFVLLNDGGAIFDTFGVVNPLIGMAAALVSAFVAVKWMVGYLQRRNLAVFGWYRIAAALTAAALVATGAI